MSEHGREVLEGITIAFTLVFGGVTGWILVFWLAKALL